jgi:hypothetical protein
MHRRTRQAAKLATCEIDSDGNKRWFLDFKRHRDGDKPAVKHKNGTRIWYWHGKLHREGDAPAAVWADGSVSYYRHGRLHRDNDEPAVIVRNKNGVASCHQWYVHDQLHREWDLPAVISRSHRYVWWDGDGDGSETMEWWRRGKRLAPAQVAAARRWSPLRASFFAAAAAAKCL